MTIHRKSPSVSVRGTTNARKNQIKTNTKSSKSSAKVGGSGSVGSASKAEAASSASGDFAVDQVDASDEREARQEFLKPSKKGDPEGLHETLKVSVKNGRFRRPPKASPLGGDGPEMVSLPKNAQPSSKRTAKSEISKNQRSKKKGIKGGAKRVEKNEDADEMQEAEGVSAMVESSAGAFFGENNELEDANLLKRATEEEGGGFRRGKPNQTALDSDAPKGLVLSQAMQFAPKALHKALGKVSLSQLENDATHALANVPRDTSGAPILDENPFSALERSISSESEGLDGLSAKSDERSRGRSEGLAFFRGRDDPMLRRLKGLEQILPLLLSADSILNGIGKSFGDSIAELGVGAGSNDEDEGGEEEVVEEEED